MQATWLHRNKDAQHTSSVSKECIYIAVLLTLRIAKLYIPVTVFTPREIGPELVERFSLAMDAVQGIVPILFSLTASAHNTITTCVNMKTTLRCNAVGIDNSK